MSRPASVIDMFKHIADNLFNRNQTEAEAELNRVRLRKARRNRERKDAVQPIVSRSLSLHHRLGNMPRLVAYTRYGGDENAVEVQLRAIKKYCGEATTNGQNALLNHLRRLMRVA